jgi:hypothetical protein
MRWYIKDYSVEKLDKCISKIKAESSEKFHTVSLISPDEGIFCIQNDTVYRVHHNSKFTNFYFNDVQLICQHTDPIKEEIASRVPVNYLCFINATVKYAIEKDPRILLCVEYRDEIIADFYFEVVGQTVDRPLIELINDSKKEINGFLLMLN